LTVSNVYKTNKGKSPPSRLLCVGVAMMRAVSHQVHTMEMRIRYRPSRCEVCCGKVPPAQDSIQVPWF